MKQRVEGQHVSGGIGSWDLTICLFLAALVVRLHWNLVVHPLGDYVYSDMHGYLTRAEQMLEQKWIPREYNGFYPYGTHVFVWAIQRVFGAGNFDAIGTVYAVLGATVVGASHRLALRVSRRVWVPPLVAAILVFYYPLVSLGGYVLSEVPFSVCLVVATWALFRLIDEGKHRDAWVAGIAVALGFTLRPQIMASVAAVGLFWLLFRRHMGRVRLVHWAQAFVPILLIAIVSSMRLHYHTGRFGLISENGRFNQIYGRCHVKKITAHPDDPSRRRTSFGPPPLIQLSRRTEWPTLDPALEPEIEYRGYIGDKAIHDEYIRRCVEKTGVVKQLEYGLVNAMMLWRYNILWPDSGKTQWQTPARYWGRLHETLFMVAALVGMLAVLRPRRALRHALLALHLWALTFIAALYFGDVRLRTPYDPFVILLALEVYGLVGTGAIMVVRRLLRRPRNLGKNAPVEPVADDRPGAPT